MSGYHKMPQQDLYWSTRPDFGLPIVKQAMSRFTFRTIKTYFHMNDNDTIDESDRLAKVRPLISLLNERYMQFGIFSKNLSIDEQMVPYFGRHSCKMFIRNKPIRFGFKQWCLCSSDGYLYTCKPYAGAADKYDKQIGLGAHVVLELLQNVHHPLMHCIFFDNFFTSYYLLCLLNERNFFVTGTVRSNRLRGADKILKTGKSLKKSDFDYAFDRTNNISVVRWQDNAEVTIATNYDSLEPYKNVRRWSKESHRYITVSQPKFLHTYNKEMGGVDLHDNGVANYRVRIRGRKWWWPIWINCLGSAIVNAWKLHIIVAKYENCKPLTQLEFRSAVATQLLLESVEPSEDEEDIEEEERPRELPRINLKHHSVVLLPKDKKLRCKKCHKTCRYQCKKCNVTLHPTECFQTYHNDL